MLLQKEALVYIKPIALEFFLYEQLGYIVHNLWAELMYVEKLYDRHRVASIFPISTSFQVNLKQALTILLVILCHNKLFPRQKWKIFVAERL